MMIRKCLNRKLGGENEMERESERVRREREKESHAWRHKGNLELLSVFKGMSAFCGINEMSSGPSPDNRSVLWVRRGP